MVSHLVGNLAALRIAEVSAMPWETIGFVGLAAWSVQYLWRHAAKGLAYWWNRP